MMVLIAFVGHTDALVSFTGSKTIPLSFKTAAVEDAASQARMKSTHT